MHWLENIPKSYLILVYDFVKFNNDPNDLYRSNYIRVWCKGWGLNYFTALEAFGNGVIKIMGEVGSWSQSIWVPLPADSLFSYFKLFTISGLQTLHLQDEDNKKDNEEEGGMMMVMMMRIDR